MKVSVALPYWLDRPSEEAIAIARTTADVGIPELWVGEMLTYDAFGLAGALAVQHPSIELTIGPLAIGVRDPVAMALGVATVSSLGDRPAHLALGASSPMVVDDWHGRPYEKVLATMEETAIVARTALAGDRTDFQGEAVRSRGFRLRTGTGGSSLSIAAFGPKMLEVAGRIADRVVLAHVAPSQVASVRRRIDEVAAAAGRPRPTLVVWCMAAIRSGEATVEQLKRNLVIYVKAPGYRAMFEEAGFGELVQAGQDGASPKELLARMPVEMVQLLAPLGSTEAVVAQIEALQGAGADEVCLVPSTVEDDAAETLLSEIVGVVR